MVKIILSMFVIVFLTSIISNTHARSPWDPKPVITPPPDEFINKCVPTPELFAEDFPPKFVPSSNLRRITGSPKLAEGMPVTLQGRVVDEKCVPVEQAKIELWQVDARGKYHHREENKNVIDKHFAGSGITLTDNKGNFSFITIYPASYGKRAPLFHLRITHPQFSDLETQIFVANDFKKEKDPVFSSLERNERRLVIAGRTDSGKYTEPTQLGERYFISLTLVGQSDYRGY